MRITHVLCGLLLVVAFVHSSPVVKREAESEDLSPLNEVYIVEAEDDEAANADRTDRDKRKIGIVKLGVTNGIINFVFGKLDSFLDSKTRALSVLDESNKIKNAAFGIDNKQSATGQFISNFVASKVQAATGSIGPVINSATTFLSSAKNGLAGAVVSKLAPLSSLSGSLTGGLSGGAGASTGVGASAGAGLGAGLSAGSTGSGGGGGLLGGGSTGGILSGLLGSKISGLTSLSGSSSSGSGGPTGGSNANAASGAGAGAGINLGAFANLGGGETSTTTEDIPEFNRMRVSLDIPPPAFGTGFTLVTNVSKILSNVILNSARRTQTLLEIFKPFFRGTFAIKGLPSDDHQ